MATSGSKRVTADDNVTAGRPTVVYSVTWLSGATAGTLQLRNGTADTDTLYIDKDGTINDSATITFENGLHFPDGLFYDHDANTTHTVINYAIRD